MTWINWLCIVVGMLLGVGLLATAVSFAPEMGPALHELRRVWAAKLAGAVSRLLTG